MKAANTQKPNLTVAAATAAKRIFLRPGMMFRPE
jgi:hypothetical protein